MKTSILLLSLLGSVLSVLAQTTVSLANVSERVPIPPLATSIRLIDANPAHKYTLRLFDSPADTTAITIDSTQLGRPITNGTIPITPGVVPGIRLLTGRRLTPTSELQVSRVGDVGQTDPDTTHHSPPPPPVTDVELIPFNDAKRLLADKSQLTTYLLRYFDLDASQANQLGTLVAENQFLTKAGITIPTAPPVDTKTLNAAELTGSDSPNGVVGPQALISATQAAELAGSFISKRFKEEINVAYVKRFRKLLAERPDSLMKLMPETALVLLNNDPYNYTSFLETLQTSFNTDLQQLPFNTIDYAVFNRSRIAQPLDINPVLFDATLASLQLVGSLQQTKDIPRLLGEFGNSRGVKAIQDNTLRSTLQVVSLLARNGTTDIEGKTFLTAAQLKELADETLLNLFLGLILAKERSTLMTIQVDSHGGPVALYKALNNLTTPLPAFRKALVSLQTGLVDLKATKDLIATEKNKEKPVLAGLYTDLFETGVGICEQVTTLYATIGTVVKAPSTPTPLITAFSVGRESIKVVRNVIDKRYGEALIHSVSLLQRLFMTKLATAPLLSCKQQRLRKKAQRLQGQLAASGAGTGATVRVASLAMAPNQTSVANDMAESLGDGRTVATGVVGHLMHYGTFMISLVKADTKEARLQALEDAALPVGSYRIKRNNRFNVSINSFGGIYGGYQNLQIVDSEQPGGTKSNYRTLLAPSAPVGLYIGWGGEQRQVRTRDSHSNGFFISLLDVGGVFALRLNDENTADLPELAWKNIAAPGLYFVHGFSNVLTLGAGAQYGPEVRSFKGDQAVFDPKAWRFGIKLTADIPIFNLYTKANRNGL